MSHVPYQLLNRPEKFAASVYRCPMSGCWLWTAGLDRGGYGRFKFLGGKLAHRAAWQLYVGPIPLGLLVLHRCDVRSCVNPAHLFLGTTADNNADMIAKGRDAAPFGARQGGAKLTDDDVLLIRQDPRKQQAIVDDFGITQTNVSQIKLRLTWRHLRPSDDESVLREMRALLADAVQAFPANREQAAALGARAANKLARVCR